MVLDFVSNFCSQNNLKIIKLLNENYSKNTCVVLIESDKNKKYVLKIYGGKTSEEFKIKFKNELNYYSNNFSQKMNKVISIGENHILLEYFGTPLRDYFDTIIDNDLDNYDFENLFREIKDICEWFFFRDGPNSFVLPNNVDLVTETLFDRIGNLTSSGPPGTLRPKFEYFITRQIFKLTQNKLRKKIFQKVQKWSLSGSKLMTHNGHYDFHARNILTNQNFNELKLIDYENYGSPGVWLSDILYLFGTINSCFYQNPEIQKKIENFAQSYISSREPNIDTDSLSKLYRIFCLAGLINSRFRLRNQHIDIKKIISYFISIQRF